MVAGATGVFGAALAPGAERGRGALALAGRDAARLEELADEHEAPTARFDAEDSASCERAVDALAAALGGLDAIAVTVGAPAFGPAEDLSPELAEGSSRSTSWPPWPSSAPPCATSSRPAR